MGQVLRNADVGHRERVDFSGKKRYEGVRFNVIRGTRGWGGGPISRKKVNGPYVSIILKSLPIYENFKKSFLICIYIYIYMKKDGQSRQKREGRHVLQNRAIFAGFLTEVSKSRSPGHHI